MKQLDGAGGRANRVIDSSCLMSKHWVAEPASYLLVLHLESWSQLSQCLFLHQPCHWSEDTAAAESQHCESLEIWLWTDFFKSTVANE